MLEGTCALAQGHGEAEYQHPMSEGMLTLLTRLGGTKPQPREWGGCLRILLSQVNITVELTTFRGGNQTTGTIRGSPGLSTPFQI